MYLFSLSLSLSLYIYIYLFFNIYIYISKYLCISCAVYIFMYFIYFVSFVYTSLGAYRILRRLPNLANVFTYIFANIFANITGWVRQSEAMKRDPPERNLGPASPRFVKPSRLSVSRLTGRYAG